MATVKLSTLVVSVAVVAGACHARPPAVSPSRSAAPATVPATPPPPPAPAAARAPHDTPLSDEELFRRKSLDELNGEHPLDDAFFAYDQSTLSDADRTALQKDAQWLHRWSQTVVRIDGYCDERGTPEYNLALGDRRALVVEDYLTSLGVPKSRIETRSLGKEAAFCHDANEACWSQNRRGHFVITAK